jgi:hypothetical protein
MMLENLEPAKRVDAPSNFRPGIEFDGTNGEATTPPLPSQNFDEFLIDAGFDPTSIQIVGTPKTSRWQRYDGEWLTAYKFQFRRVQPDFDLPALFASARKVKATKPPEGKEKVLILAPADFQIGKTGSRGGTQQLIERVFASYAKAEEMAKRGKYERIYILDMGDLIESISNTADQQQIATNDISVPTQIDLGVTLMWELVKRMSKFAPVTYGSIASNHCQVRSNRQTIGRPGEDDYGILVLKQLHRLAKELEMNVDFLIPEPEDEGFAFRYGIHTIGVVHGHQVRRPDGIPEWWSKQQFGSQWAESVSLMLTGHFHHLRVQELGQYRIDGEIVGSKYWVQMPTSDSGSDWFRRISGQDSATGIGAIELDPSQPYLGQVHRL